MYEKKYIRGQSNVVYKISLNFELQKITIKKLTKCSNATVKVRLRSTELVVVRSHKVCSNCTFNVQ